MLTLEGFTEILGFPLWLIGKIIDMLQSIYITEEITLFNVVAMLFIMSLGAVLFNHYTGGNQSTGDKNK